MNEITRLCKALGLGAPLNEPRALPNGFNHKTFAVETPQGRYVIKALNPARMADEAARAAIVRSEGIAREAAKSVPAVPALLFKGQALQELDGAYYLVFDYIEGEDLDSEELSPVESAKMGDILARLHSVDFAPLGLINAEPEADLPEIDWEGHLRLGREQGSVWLGALEENIALISGSFAKAAAANRLLECDTLISHRNLDPRNVLWQGGEPRLIDWEEANFVNPLDDLMQTALHWSREDDGGVSYSRLRTFIEAYKARHLIVPADWKSILTTRYIEPVVWLDFCLRRSLGLTTADPEERALGAEQSLYMIEREIVPFGEKLKPLAAAFAEYTC